MIGQIENAVMRLKAAGVEPNVLRINPLELVRMGLIITGDNWHQDFLSVGGCYLKVDSSPEYPLHTFAVCCEEKLKEREAGDE